MSDKKIILVGYSGHGLVVADTALENNLNVIGYTEKSVIEVNPFKLEYLGDESSSNFKEWDLDVSFILGIGDNILREKIYKHILKNGKKVISLINLSSSISSFAAIGDGVFVNRNVTINAFAKIGSNVILNTGCIVEHECEIHDNVHIGPGAVLAGNVKVGSGSFIGANSVIKQGVEIGKNVIVGAGTVVLNNISDRNKIVGNPHRFI
ncbi:MAG: acetyltransferase [Chitinophagaceae bacterium]|nr:acetyltransferase [Chitinophagaceae bacterium]